MSAKMSLLEIYETIKKKQWIDLTHSFAPGIPHASVLPNEERETLYYYDEGVGSLGSAGIFIQRFCHVGQWGTMLILQHTSSKVGEP